MSEIRGGKFRLAIIGAGRVGTTLAYLLKRRGHRIETVISRSLAHAKKAVEFISAGQPTTRLTDISSRCNLFLITTPDTAIARVAEALSRLALNWRQSVVFHCSGYLDSTVLRPLTSLGSATCAMHPLQTFPRPETAIKWVRGSFFSLEGDRRGVKTGKQLVKELEAEPIVISQKAKGSYHCAATLACGHLAALVTMATALMRKAGIEEKKAKRMLYPLIKGTLDNSMAMRGTDLFTGPIVRQDLAIVKNHIEASEKLSQRAAQIYKLLGLEILDRVSSKRRPTADLKALRNLLKASASSTKAGGEEGMCK